MIYVISETEKVIESETPKIKVKVSEYVGVNFKSNGLPDQI